MHGWGQDKLAPNGQDSLTWVHAVQEEQPPGRNCAKGFEHWGMQGKRGAEAPHQGHCSTWQGLESGVGNVALSPQPFPERGVRLPMPPTCLPCACLGGAFTLRAPRGQ